jgi:hypothetical protein
LNKYNNIGKLAPPIPAFEKGRLKNRCCIWSCEMVIEILSLKPEGEIEVKFLLVTINDENNYPGFTIVLPAGFVAGGGGSTI